MSAKPRPRMSAKKGGQAELTDEPDPQDGLTDKQREAVEALALGQSTAQAAAAAKVSPRTVRRWGRDPQFHSALLELRREAVGQAMTLMQRYAPAAVGTLLRVMNDAAAPAGSKVTAATAVIKGAYEGVELADLAMRVHALETSNGQGPVLNPAAALPHPNEDQEESERDPE